MLKVRRSISEIRIWREKFQEKVDKISGINYLKFTCEAWNPGGNLSQNETKTNSMVTDKTFPLLDLESFWDDSGML